MVSRVGYPLYVFFLCMLSLTLLTFCGDDKDNNTQDSKNDATTPVPSPLPSPNTQNTASKPEHRFYPAKITAGLPFSFEFSWANKPASYLLGLDNCGTDALLLQGNWPDTQEITTYIKGVNDERLTNLVVVNTSGNPTIPAGCQLKVTVARGAANEESTSIPLDIKAGVIALSNASIDSKTVVLDATGVPSTNRSGVVVARKDTFIADGETYAKYVLVAISHPLNSAVQNDRVDSNVTLYEPPPELAVPTEKISAFETGDYLISVINFAISGWLSSDLDIDFFHVSAITARASQGFL